MTTATQAAVTKADPRDAAALARTLARAFTDDPVNVWFLPREADRPQRTLRSFEQVFLRRIALPRDATFTVADHAGVALWLPPGQAQLGALEQLRLLPAMVRAFGRDLPRGLRGMSAMDAVHPHDPHWYLWFLGVEPERQGEGLGSRLLAEVLERCDRDRVPAYLQATTARSRELYLRHGFEDSGELRLPDDGPQLWPMWREPGA